VARVDSATPGGVGSPAVAGAEPSAGNPARSRWAAINACLLPALAFDGQEVITAEGLGSAESPGREAELHPVQREMVERGGSQCGYCTPGFICSMAAEYYRPGRTSGPVSARATASGEGSEGGAEAAGGENGFDL